MASLCTYLVYRVSEYPISPILIYLILLPQLYKSELENEFSQFMDWLHTFPIFKGKANFDEEDENESDRIMGKYKVNLQKYYSSNKINKNNSAS